MYKHIQSHDERAARNLNKGWVVSVNNGGDDDEIAKSSDFGGIFYVMGESDEDIVVFHDADGKRLGSALLVYGNDEGETIADYSTSLEAFMKEQGL